MEAFWKAAAIILVTIILGATIGKTEKDIFLVLTVAACCIVLVVAMEYLLEIVGFLWRLAGSSEYGRSYMDILLKISGVAIMTEWIGMIGADAGNSALGKAMQILGNAAILVLSLPLFEAFLAIIQEIMEYL